MMKGNNSIVFCMLMVLLVACGGSGSDDEPQISKDFLSVTPNLELLGDGQTTEITVSANCSWTISKDVDWLTVSPMSGTNTQTITVSAMKNTTGSDRKAVLSIKGGSLPVRMVTITQFSITEQQPSDNPTSHEPGADDNQLPS